MKFIWSLASILCALPLASLPASASHLVTGNGFGFGVVSPENGTVSKFYAHPYSFVRPDPKNPLSEGIETANFINEIGWKERGGSSLQGSNGLGASVTQASAEYEDDSQIIHIRRRDGEGLVFMPFGLRLPTLIVSWEPNAAAAQAGELDVKWNRSVSAQWVVENAGVEMHVLKFDGIAETLLLIPLGARLAGPAQPSPANGGQILATNLSWALMSLEKDNDVEQAAGEFNRWRAGMTPRALAAREIAELEHWRVRPAIHFASDKERHLWRQSEVMLRMAQSREPNGPDGDGKVRNGNGLIVAALPDGVYFTPWVRDMAYALVALIRMGHQAEARAGLLAYFNAQPTGKMRAQTGGIDYQISVVRYFGDGAEEPFFTEEGATNIEFDDWGLALWVLGEYVRKFDDPHLLSTATYRGLLYPSARDFVVKPLLRTLERYGGGEIVTADTSIWEEHQKDKKHFAWSTAMAIVGLENFAEVAHRAGDNSAQTDALAHVAQLRKGFAAAFIREGALHGTLEPGEKNDIDGALLAIINFGIVTDPALVNDTVARMDLLKVASGGYKRVRSNYTDPAIFEFWYEKEEFLFVDFSLAEVDRRLGKTADADAMLRRIVSKAAADHDIIPEMYVAVPCQLFPGQIGDPTGALPMVGYGAGEFIQHVLEREALQHKP